MLVGRWGDCFCQVGGESAVPHSASVGQRGGEGLLVSAGGGWGVVSVRLPADTTLAGMEGTC